MNIENINPDSITDINSARRVVSQLVDCIFEMKRDIDRRLLNLTSQNVRSLDFNITTVKNADVILKK